MEKRREKVSYEEVVRAAESIIAAGAHPSIRAVREKVGGGSLGTIQKHLAEWSSKTRALAETSALSSIPQGLSSLILEELQKFAATARGELAATEADRNALAEENEVLATKIESLTLEHEAQAAQLQQQTGSLSLLRSELDTQKALAEKARSEAEQARGVLVRAEAHQERASRLDAELRKTLTELKTENERRHEVEQKASILTEKLESLTLRLQEQEKQRELSTQRSEALTAELLAANKETFTAELRRKDLEEQIARGEAQQARRIELETLTAIAHERERFLAETKTQIDTERALKNELLEWEKTVWELKKKIATLEAAGK